MSTTDPQILQVAAAHGLDLDPDSVEVNEMGLDFRVALATTVSSSTASSSSATATTSSTVAEADQRWVLRIPRRPDALERAEVEGRLLATVHPPPGGRRPGLAGPLPRPDRLPRPAR